MTQRAARLRGSRSAQISYELDVLALTSAARTIGRREPTRPFIPGERIDAMGCQCYCLSHVSRLFVVALVVVLAGCGSPTPVVAGGVDSGAAGSDAGAGVDAGAVIDAGSIVDAGPGVVDAGVPRCSFYDSKVNCPPIITPLLGRDVYWQFPSSPAPAAGFPAVVIYQGSFFAPSGAWGEVPSSALFNGFQQARLHALLLEHGFTVITPSAAGGVAWQTNSGLSWDSTSDKTFIDGMLAGMRTGTFGPIDMTHLFAAGISSGGYMTSRMAVSYPGVFRALIIHSGSYATCAGFVCVLPTMLPARHPPTRFLHGRGDLTVPLYTAEAYEQALTAQGFETDMVIDDAAGHEWLSIAPERILEWVQAH